MGARLDDELFAFLLQPDTREYLRMVLINTCFAPEIRPVLIRQGKVDVKAYSKKQWVKVQKVKSILGIEG